MISGVIHAMGSWQADCLCMSSMGRNPRSNLEGATYHVMNRGNRKAVIFEDDRDCKMFMRILTEVIEVHDVKLLGGSLMRNHFHCALTTPRGNLSSAMQHLEGQFARYSNWRHRRVGHLFQGRFRDVLIEHDLHLLIALCYIFMNPVAAGLCAQPQHYKWSTYAASVGRGPIPSCLSLDWLDALFPSATRDEAQQSLQNLFSHAKPVAAYLHNLDIGVDRQSLNSVVRSYIGGEITAALPREYQLALRPPLEELMPEVTDRRRLARAIADAHITHGYKLVEIAKTIGMKPTTVSKFFRQHRAQAHATAASVSGTADDGS